MKEINKEQLLKKMRIAWLVLLVATLALLSIGIYNLISDNPFVGEIGAIIMTALGGFCGMITFFLTVFSFLVPAVMKYSQVMSGFDGSEAKELVNMQKQIMQRQLEDNIANSNVAYEARYCRFCGKPIHPDSKFCPFCGKDLDSDTF